MPNLALVDLNKNKVKISYEKKVNIALQYQSIIYKTLIVALRYNLDDGQKDIIAIT